jgi:hypothetical protein
MTKNTKEPPKRANGKGNINFLNPLARSMTLDILMTISSAATPQGKGYLMVVLGPTHP